MTDPHRLSPGESVDLDRIDPDGKQLYPDRAEAEREFEELRGELIDWQRRLYAEGRRKLLVVLQALDAGGKDSAIRKVFSGVNPQGVHVASFKAPSKEELAHDYLWRIHREVPAAGMIGVFNRSHYEDVLVVRVDDLVPGDVWRKRYDQINGFERLLTDTGTTILKFYLHISKGEQRERLQDRLDDPDKHWKFDPHDLVKRKQWREYREAYEDMLERCTTEHAPWYVIPADKKWCRNVAMARVIVGTLREMDPTYPEAAFSDEELEGFEID